MTVIAEQEMTLEEQFKAMPQTELADHAMSLDCRLAWTLEDLDRAVFSACARMVKLAWDEPWEMHTLENLAEFRITFYLPSEAASLRVFESIFGTNFVFGDAYEQDGDVWVRITPDSGWELNASHFYKRGNTQHACAGKR